MEKVYQIAQPLPWQSQVPAGLRIVLAYSTVLDLRVHGTKKWEYYSSKITIPVAMGHCPSVGQCPKLCRSVSQIMQDSVPTMQVSVPNYAGQCPKLCRTVSQTMQVSVPNYAGQCPKLCRSVSYSLRVSVP
jgi:hypothetical protein